MIPCDERLFHFVIYLVSSMEVLCKLVSQVCSFIYLFEFGAMPESYVIASVHCNGGEFVSIQL